MTIILNIFRSYVFHQNSWLCRRLELPISKETVMNFNNDSHVLTKWKFYQSRGFKKEEFSEIWELAYLQKGKPPRYTLEQILSQDSETSNNVEQGDHQ